MNSMRDIRAGKIRDYVKQAIELVKAGKDLVKEVNYNVEQSQQKVVSKEWTQAELEQSRANLRTKQEKAWEGLISKAEGLKPKLEGPYKLLVAAKEAILRARGDSVTGSVFGSLTPDQKEVRKVFDNKLTHKFDEATAAYNGLMAYPDGLLLQPPILQKRASESLNVGVSK